MDSSLVRGTMLKLRIVSDQGRSLAKRGSGGYRLADGDVLRMGEYHIVAALEARPAQDEAGAAVPTSIHALHTLGRHEPDIGASLDLDALLVPANQAGSILPVNAYGQSVDSGRVRALNPKARAERASEVPLLDGAGAQSLGRQMARSEER